MASENEFQTYCNEEQVSLLTEVTDDDQKQEEQPAEASLPRELTNDEEQVPLPMDTTTDDQEKEEEETNLPSSAPVKHVEEEKHHSQSNLDQSFIIEGKRSRRPTLRLELTESTSTKKELPIPQGHGTPLGEIEYINHQISHASTDALSRMRHICFGRRGKEATLRKDLRKFKGFDFDSQTAEYQKHRSNLTKLKKEQLRSLSNILGLSLSGRNTELAERILNFLLKPTDEGKKLAVKKTTTQSKKKRVTKSRENGEDFHFKPGKKRSLEEEENSNDAKRPKGVSNSEEEAAENAV